MNEHLPEKTDQRALQKYAGRPQEPFREGEATRWQRFLQVLLPWLNKKGKTADKLAEMIARAEARRRTAEARKSEAEARKSAAEAAEIAARADQQRLSNIRVACDLADEKFADTPAVAGAIKLSALQKLDPNIEEQIAKLNARINDLAARHGTQVQIITEPAALPVPEDSHTQPKK